MKLPSDKLGTPVLALAVFIGTMLILSIFFFITIYKNENILDKRGFRILTQLGSAMKEQDEVITKVLTNLKDSKNFKVQRRITSLFSSFVLTDHDTNTFIDTLFYTSVKGDTKSNSKKGNNKIDTTKGKNKNAENTKVKVVPKQKENDISSLRVNVSIKDFITPLLRTDFFSKYILIRDSVVAFSSFPGDISFLKNIFPRKKSGSTSIIPSSLTSISPKDSMGILFLQGGFIEKINIQGTEYEVFFIPLRFHDGKNYYLGGFVEEKIFLGWKRSLPPNVIVIFIIILLFIIFGLPVLKVFISGAMEKLTRFGVTSIGIYLVIGIILAVVLFSYLLLDHKINKDNYRNLKRLNLEITTNFNRERDKILLEMKQYDAQWTNHSDSDSIKKSILDYSIIKTSLNSFLTPNYRNFKTLFWANDTGKQLLFMTPYTQGYKSSVRPRSYFQFPDRYSDTIYIGKKPEKVWYGMEPIYSNTSGDWGIAFSMPSQQQPHAKITAMTSPLYSIKNPVLPYGYEYCLIEKTGRVWYHSAEFFNINDNLMTECDNERFTSDLQSNSADNLKVEMRNQKYLMVLSPIKNTDLFLVALFNTSRVNLMTSFSASFAICFIAALLLIIWILFSFFRALGWMGFSKLNKGDDKYFLSWFTPKRSGIKKYGQLIWVNISVFLFLIFMELSHINNKLEIHWFLFYLFILLVIVCVCTHFVRICYSEQPEKDKDQDAKNPDDPGGKKYLQRHNLFILSWLVIIAIVPSALIMKRVYLEETRWYLDDQHHYLAQKLNDRTNLFYKFFKDNLPKNNQDSMFKARNKEGIYYPFLLSVVQDTLVRSRGIDKTPLKYPPIFIPNVAGLRNYYYQLMQEPGSFSIDPLVGNKASFGSDSVKLLFDRILYNWSLNDGNFKKSAANTLLISTRTGLENFTSDHNDLFLLVFYLVIILLLLFFIYRVIGKVVNKLFGYDELEYSKKNILEHLKALQKSDSNAVIISMNELNETDVAKEGWEFIDLAGDQKDISVSPGGKTVLYNFDSGITTITRFCEKLSTLEDALRNRHVAFLLNKSPSHFIRNLQETWKQHPDQNMVGSLISRLLKILSGLPVFYWLQPLQRVDDPIPGEDNPTFCKHINSIIKGEIRFNASFIKYKELLYLDFPKCDDHTDKHNALLEKFLKSDAIILCFRKILHKMNSENCPKADTIILRIKELSESFYQKFWNDLTPEEKFVLVDIAEDSFTNLKNKEIIQGLMGKGILIVNNEEIEFTSEGFKYFILTSADKTETKEFEIKMGKLGSWNQFKVPLILVGTSILVFLIATQQHILSNMNTIAVSVLAVMSVYLKFSGIFSKSK
jgi:Na+-transporting methylmalonyl-CoA/oxaloacetate decarboxylase gamma subunit